MSESQDIRKLESQYILGQKKRIHAVHRRRHLLSKDLKQTRPEKDKMTHQVGFNERV